MVKSLTTSSLGLVCIVVYLGDPSVCGVLGQKVYAPEFKVESFGFTYLWLAGNEGMDPCSSPYIW